MKIGHPADQPVNQPVASGHAADSAKAGSPAESVGTAGAAAAAADASAKVELSSTASALLASGPGEFDSGKVDRIGEAIANGTFKVNPEAIADKLIANAQELLAKVKT